MTATGGRPASLQRSTAASVWPERIRTPPSRAIERKDVAGPDEIACAHIAVGERADGVAALLGGNAGRHAVLDVDGNGESGAERRIVGRDHRREDEPPRVLAGQRRADDAAAVPDDEGHLFRRAERSRDDESPSFSRSSSSVTTTISPRAKASMAAVTGWCMSCPLRPSGAIKRKSLGVTAPPVSSAMRPAVSRDRASFRQIRMRVMARRRCGAQNRAGDAVPPAVAELHALKRLRIRLESDSAASSVGFAIWSNTVRSAMRLSPSRGVPGTAWSLVQRRPAPGSSDRLNPP